MTQKDGGGLSWRPIETAPEETEVLIWGASQGFALLGILKPDGWWIPDECPNEWLEVIKPPTHWMPLPEPPARQEPDQ